MKASKGNVPKILTSFLVKKIGGVLKNFLKKFDISKINLGIDNDFVMMNLELREDLLTKMQLPLLVTEGTIASLTVKFPIRYGSVHSRIHIDGITIKVRSLREKKKNFSEDESEKASEREVDFKKQRIQDWELKIQKYFEEINSSTWVKGTIDMIINNMVITFSNINFVFQNEKDAGDPFDIKLKIDKLKLSPTDDKWKKEVFSKSTKINRKRIEINGLAISLEIPEVNDPSASPIQLSFANSKRMKDTGKKKQKQPEDNNLQFDGASGVENNNYMLFPLNSELRLTLQEQDGFDLTEKRFSTLELVMKNPIIFSLNKDQIHSILVFGSTLNDLMKIHSNFHLRPAIDLGGSKDSKGGSKAAREWWRYAINAVIEEKRMSWNFYRAYKTYKMYERYVIFFKRQNKFIKAHWLRNLSVQGKRDLMELEETLTWQEIIKLREWALIELKIEAKRFMMAKNEIKNISRNLNDIWANSINQEQIVIKGERSECYQKMEDIEISYSERIGLYQMLALDKRRVISSFMDGDFYQATSVQFSISIKINSIYLMFVEKPPPNSSSEISNRIGKLKERCKCQKCSRKTKPAAKWREKSLASIFKSDLKLSAKATEEDASTGRSNIVQDSSKQFCKEFEDIEGEKLDYSQKKYFKETGKTLQEQKDIIRNAHKQLEIVTKSEQKHILLVLLVEIINIQGDIQIKRNGSLKTSRMLTVEVINVMDSDFFSVSPDLHKGENDGGSHTTNPEEVDNVTNINMRRLYPRLNMFKLKESTQPKSSNSGELGEGSIINETNNLETRETKENIFLDLPRPEKDPLLFKKFRMKSRVVGNDLFLLAITYKMSENSYFYSFLERYGMQSYAYFLEQYAQDAKNNEKVLSDFDITSYDKYFYEQSQYYLHLTNPQIQKLKDHIDESKKKLFIQTTYNLIIYLIKEYLYTGFIREYGM